jgi:hypothetical protein
MTNDEILALLNDGSLKPASIAEEMEMAGRERPSAEQVESARDAQQKLQGQADAGPLAAQIAALPEVLALALVHAAGRAARQEVLLPVASGPNKALVKEAKRELQRLKQRGVQVQELKPTGEAVLKPLPEAEAPSCYVSSIDAYGERAVWWARAARQGVEVVQVVYSDVKGILAADALALSRRSWREFVKRLPRQAVVFTAEISKDYARTLIAEAEAAGARNGFSPPPTYAEALRLLGPAPDPAPRPPGESIDLPRENEHAHQLEGAALFSDPLFAAWIPEEDSIRSFALRVDEIAVSQLYVDERQKQEAFERAADEASQAYFTSPRRALYSRRLLEMAHVLRAAGRDEAAMTAVAVSRALLTEAQSPFTRALFTHALQDRLRKAAEKPEQTTSSGLITP